MVENPGSGNATWTLPSILAFCNIPAPKAHFALQIIPTVWEQPAIRCVLHRPYRVADIGGCSYAYATHRAEAPRRSPRRSAAKTEADPAASIVNRHQSLAATSHVACSPPCRLLPHAFLRLYVVAITSRLSLHLYLYLMVAIFAPAVPSA